MNVRTKIAEGYRGEPEAFVTLSSGTRPGYRLTPAEARQLARDLDAAANAADALVIAPDLRRMGVAVAEAARTAREHISRLWDQVSWCARSQHQSEPHSFKECETFAYTRTPCERCR
jgi:hypothetical protein